MSSPALVFDPRDPIGWALPLVVGLASAALVTTGGGRLVDPLPRSDRLVRGGVALAVMLTALGTWWWEVHGGAGSGSVAAPGMHVVLRWAAHQLLFALLAAAAWVDIRHRVIPDAITVPGVLAGLAWLTAAPDALLPILRDVPRSFAMPLREPDVLGVFGSLRGPWPDWLAPRPALAGLALVAAVFAVWCLVGTEPDEARREGGGSAWWAAWLRPRPVAITSGAAVLLGGWFVGGDHWRGLVSSLAGIVVSGGIIWLTRAGASRALGREAMGLGDVTLMAMVGAWLGWQPCLLACFLAVFIGLVHGVTQLVVRSETELPFGPSLCLAAAVVVVWWRPLWQQTEAFFERPGELALVVGAVIVLTAVTLWIWHRIRPISAA